MINLKQIANSLPPQQQSCDEFKKILKEELPNASDFDILEIIEIIKTQTLEEFNDFLFVPVTLSCFNSLKRLVINEARSRGLIPGLTTNEKIVVVLGIIGAAGFAAAVILKK